MECDVKADSSFLEIILWTTLAASCNTVLMWILFMKHTFFPFLISWKTAIGLSLGTFSFIALWRNLLQASTTQWDLFAESLTYDIIWPLSPFF